MFRILKKSLKTGLVTAEEFDQAVGGGDIGPNGVRAAAAVMGKMAPPTSGKRARRMPFPC